MWRPRDETAIYMPRGEASEETSLAGSLIEDFQPSELWDHVFLLFKPPSPWHFVMAALADKHRYWSQVILNRWNRRKRAHVGSSVNQGEAASQPTEPPSQGPGCPSESSALVLRAWGHRRRFLREIRHKKFTFYNIFSSFHSWLLINWEPDSSNWETNPIFAVIQMRDDNKLKHSENGEKKYTSDMKGQHGTKQIKKVQDKG